MWFTQRIGKTSMRVWLKPHRIENRIVSGSVRSVHLLTIRPSPEHPLLHLKWFRWNFDSYQMCQLPDSNHSSLLSFQPDKHFCEGSDKDVDGQDRRLLFHKQNPLARCCGICLKVWVPMLNKTIAPPKHWIQLCHTLPMTLAHQAAVRVSSVCVFVKPWLTRLTSVFVGGWRQREKEGERWMHMWVPVCTPVHVGRDRRRTLSAQLHHCLLHSLETRN